MSASAARGMTQEEFLDWADTQEGKFEFDGVRPLAMTRPTVSHALICGNIHFQLKLALRGGRCVAVPADGAGVQTIDGRLRFPDGLITCSPLEPRQRLVADPVVVFEVVSESSLREDRIRKVAEYLTVPSIATYAIVEQSVIGITMLSRGGAGGWVANVLEEGGVFRLPELGVEIPIELLYEDVVFDEPDTR